MITTLVSVTATDLFLVKSDTFVAMVQNIQYLTLI